MAKKESAPKAKEKVSLGDLVDRTAKRMKGEVTKSVVDSVAHAFLDEIGAALVNKEPVVFVGKFALVPVWRAERTASNPQNREQKVTVPAHWALRVKPGKNLLDEMES